MGIIAKIFKRAQPSKSQRSYAGAKINRLTSDWTMQSGHINDTLRHDLATLRGRSRDLSLNNPYVGRYFNLLKTNIIGGTGITLQGMSVNPDGKLDTNANEKLEQGWKEWGSQYASLDGRSNFLDIERQVIEGVARDGEVFIRSHRIVGDNPFAFTLELIDPSRIDETLNEEKLKNGNSIHLGIEFDNLGRPIAYYLKTRTAHENSTYLRGTSYTRIPAEEILHIGKQERPGQVRFAPWIASVMGALKQLDGYQEGELIAARIAASKMGFFTSPEGEQYGEEDAGGSLVTEAEPGMFEQLPEGWDFKSFDPQHPAGNYAPFVKSTLRTIAAGLNVTYASLAGDLESVNFSSIRQGALEERDRWRADQKWLIDRLHRPIYRAWLQSALLTQAVALPAEKYSKFTRIEFRPRGFGWVDPLKDMKAAAEGIAMGVQTRSEVCARAGVDFEDVVEQLAREQELLDKYGIKLGADESPTEQPATKEEVADAAD